MNEEIIKKFERTAIDSEKSMRVLRKKQDDDYCKNEIDSSINHLSVSLDKWMNELDEDVILCSKDHIDNIYYHLGKIKAMI